MIAVAHLSMRDPPDEVIAGISTVGHAYALAGLTQGEIGDDAFPGKLCNSLLTHLGFTLDSYVEVYTANRKEETNADIGQWLVTDPVAGTQRPANMGAKGLARLGDRYMRMRVGEITRDAALSAIE